MNTKAKSIPRILALAMAIAMALTMTVSAFASAAQPYNLDTTKLSGRISQADQMYTATVNGPVGTTKTELDMVLYEKGLFGYKEVDSASASANKNKCTKTVSYEIKSGKDYKLTVTGRSYANGQWDESTQDFFGSF